MSALDLPDCFHRLSSEFPTYSPSDPFSFRRLLPTAIPKSEQQPFYISSRQPSQIPTQTASDTQSEPFSFISLPYKTNWFETQVARIFFTSWAFPMLYSRYSRQPAVLWLTNNSTYFRQRSRQFLNQPYQSMHSSLAGLKLMLSVKFTIFFAGGIMCAQDYKLKFTFEVVVWALQTIFWKKQ